MSFDLTNLSNADLEVLHKSLHADVADPVKVQAHHLVTTELLVRGLDHGHKGDEWNRAVIEVGVENNVPVNKAFDGIPSDVVDTVNVELGYPESVSKTTILTVDGYTLKFDTVAKDAPMNMNDPEPEDALNETQSAIYEFLESLTETVGKFNKGCGANGAHYMEENPFMSEGLMCANCVFYEGGQGCEIVEGQIDHCALCKFWIIPENLLNGMSKHMQGKHDQSTHGDWAHGSSVSGSDFQAITKILSKKTVRLSYNDGYDSGRELKRTNSNPFAIPAVMKRHEELHGLLDNFRKGSDSLTNGVYADQIVTDAGFFDALNGSKRRYRRLLVDPIPQLSTIPLLKHLAGQHDQSTHGSWAKSPAGEGLHAPEAGSNKIYRDTAEGGGNYGGVKRGTSTPEATGGYKYGIPEAITGKEWGGSESITPSDSAWHHLMPNPNYTTTNGQLKYVFTPERLKLHEEIVHTFVDGTKSQKNPTYYLIGGGPASGKTTMIRKGKVGVPQPITDPATDAFISSGDAVQVNADMVKTMIPEMKRMSTSTSMADFKGAGTHTHEESSMLAKAIEKAGLAKRADIVYDSTGNGKFENLLGKIDTARQKGYVVKAFYATVSVSEAIRRSNNRAKTERRYVPHSVIRKIHKGVSLTAPLAFEANAFDEWKLVSTEGFNATVIAQGGKNTPKVVFNQGMWDNFIEKGHA